MQYLELQSEVIQVVKQRHLQPPVEVQRAREVVDAQRDVRVQVIQHQLVRPEGIFKPQ